MKKEIGFNYTHIESGKESSFDEEKLNNKEVVLEPNQEIKLRVDYPLDNAYEETFNTGPTGMTRGKLAKKICETYKKIYKEEEESMNTTQEELDDRPGLLNRPSSDGKYGIWGHDIGDLMLGSAELNEGVLTLGIDS